MRRREFLRLSGGAFAFGLVGCGGSATSDLVQRAASASLSTQRFRPKKFIQALPGLGASGIRLATKDTTSFPGVDFYDLEAAQFQHQFHPQIPPSTVWGYADRDGPHSYLGGVIVATKDTPVRLRMTNKLPGTHPLPIDTTLPGSGPDQAQNRIAVHLHGGFVPWNSDGNPLSWFAPDGSGGEIFVNPGPVSGSAEYFYPNQQSARLMWFHDHAIGNTRLNAYAGLASAYVLTDDVEQSLISNGVLPGVGIPLVIQDKTFVTGADPNYIWGRRGDLFYPYLYDAEVGPTSLEMPVPSCVPEFFGDTTMVNGAAYPFLKLEARHHRFRILNGSQARFYNLQLYYAEVGGTFADLTKPGPPMVQIGTEGGFLPAPVILNDPPAQIQFDATTGNAVAYTLLLAPAERADIIIDFTDVKPGSKLILYSDSPGPFPAGDDPAAGDNMGPDQRALLQFRIVARSGAPDSANADALLTTPGLLPDVPALSGAARTRDLTLNEDFDEFGRLIQRLGTAAQNGLNSEGNPTFARNYMDDPTETPTVGDTEVWRIFNLTGDTHPIHFHLVNVQVVLRQQFDPATFVSSGPDASLLNAFPPVDPNERGWKETVRMNPGECTTVIMRFDLPHVPFDVPLSTRTSAPGYEYVWHCHILEHEEHDMMRPLIVKPS